MSNHITPGPWRIKGWSGDEAFVVATNPSNGKDMHVTLTCTNGDARAIALVPEMVEALRKIANPQFNCSPNQYSMAMQGVADALLSKLDAPHG